MQPTRKGHQVHGRCPHLPMKNIMTIAWIIKALFNLAPVLIFLILLVWMDSFKLVKYRDVLIAIFWGIVVAIGSLFLNSWAVELLSFKVITYSRYIAPIFEEVLKAILLIFFIKKKRIGFMVDGAILGFAIGAGFALIENIYQMQVIESANIYTWLVRGLGTAVMHGGCTAIMAIITMNLIELKSHDRIVLMIPGILAAILLHSLFNHFILPPIYITFAVIIIMPLSLIVVYALSEKSTRQWLGAGFDSDTQLLGIIVSGNIQESKVGSYFNSLKTFFSGDVMADMLCYLRLYLELSIGAKGVLLLRKEGVPVPDDPEIKDKFRELKYLEKSIGKTGKLAIAPFIHTSDRDLWQLYMLK